MKAGAWILRYPGHEVAVPRTASLEETADAVLSAPEARDVFVVGAAGKLLGCLPHRRLAALLLAEHRPRSARRHIAERAVRGTVGELMERVHPVHQDDELADVLHRVLEHGLEDMPVVDDAGTLVGSIRLTDILRAVRAGEL